MPQFDLPLDQLETYRTTTEEPAGLNAWWAARLAAARAAAAPPELVGYAPDVYGPLPVADVTFSGADGHRIRGWYLRPPRVPADEPLPVVVTFIGYGGGRGLPADHTRLAAVGFAELVMDTRGQGGSWTTGATGDPGRTGEGPERPGLMTRGLDSPEGYYYTRLFTDAVRAVETAASLPGVDPDRIAVGGLSQGGGLALAAAALAGGLVRACQADVPFLCDLRRGITIGGTLPYLEVAEFLGRHPDRVAAALRTLSYVDCALLARRITAPTLVSVGLMDETCPPSTVFAAYNEIPGEKEIAVYPFGTHDVPELHAERRLRHLRAQLGMP